MDMVNQPPNGNPPQVTPSPEADEVGVEKVKYIGHEFVRQYYTQMNEAPNHLHRFFTHQSSFIHGAEQKPVFGQKAIHQRIMSLNLNKCLTKIHHLDSHPTIGHGIVVQVSGELSNNGKPMRSFMQTFVLVPKVPKRYFVQNHIFRYNDEVFFKDDETDAEQAEVTTEERAGGNSGVPELPSIQDNKAVYSEQEEPISKGTVQEEEADFSAPVEVPKDEVFFKDDETDAEQAEVTTEERAGGNCSVPELPSIQDNKAVYSEQEEPISKGMVQEEEADFNAAVEVPKTAEVPALEADINALDIDGETSPLEKEPLELEPSPEASKPEPEISETPKVCSWAAMASENTASDGDQSAPSLGAASHHPAKPSHPAEEKPSENPSAASATAGYPHEGEGDASAGHHGGHGGIHAKYADNQQLFVGYIPNNVSKSELTKLFEQWGKVVELQIRTKRGGRNFGFVVFDSPGPVQSVLQEKPIKLNNKRLNVKEKQPRGDSGPRAGFRPMGGNGRGGMSGPPHH